MIRDIPRALSLKPFVGVEGALGRSRLGVRHLEQADRCEGEPRDRPQPAGALAELGKDAFHTSLGEGRLLVRLNDADRRSPIRTVRIRFR